MFLVSPHELVDWLANLSPEVLAPLSFEEELKMSIFSEGKAGREAAFE